MSPYTDMLGVTVDTFPECPECRAEGKPNCYRSAPATWYPFADLPGWHVIWKAMREDMQQAFDAEEALG